MSLKYIRIDIIQGNQIYSCSALKTKPLMFQNKKMCQEWYVKYYHYFLKYIFVKNWLIFQTQLLSIVTIICCNDELSWTMSWVGCLLKDSELFILFAENSQILLKISVIPIPLTPNIWQTQLWSAQSKLNMWQKIIFLA